MRRLLWATTIALTVGILFSMGSTGYADGGDFSMDFTAAAPFSYDHATGGGAYNDRTVGKFDDIVESLEGGDFSCLDTVTYLTQIVVDGGAVGSQTIRLNFEFTAYATGQQGVALIDNTAALSTSGAINSGVIDSGTVDDDGSTATVVSESQPGPTFVKPSTFFRSVDVDDLEAGETVVVRTDVKIDCNGHKPTGNMQARLASASVVDGVNGLVIDAISSGDQTVPFKSVGAIKPPACDPKTDPTCK
jgi:hypothetical protein